MNYIYYSSIISSRASSKQNFASWICFLQVWQMKVTKLLNPDCLNLETNSSSSYTHSAFPQYVFLYGEMRFFPENNVKIGEIIDCISPFSSKNLKCKSSLFFLRSVSKNLSSGSIIICNKKKPFDLKSAKLLKE